VRQAVAEDNEALFDLIDSNPVSTDFAYVTDRRPDFFGLHRLFPDSRVFVGEDGAEGQGTRALESCCSRMVYEGRIGDRFGRFDYYTDVCRRPTGKVRGLLRGVLETAVKSSVDEGALALTALCNQGNDPVLGLMQRVGTVWTCVHAATFSLTEVVPLAAFARGSTRWARAVANDDEFHAALDLLNESHARHQLFRPFDPAYFGRLESCLPGFSRQNLWIVPGHDRGEPGRPERVQAAAIWYDPAPLFNVRVVRFDALTRTMTPVMRAIHTLTGAAFDPPREGEMLRTLHVQAMAHRNLEAGRGLLRAISNLARDLGKHTYSFMVDERERWPVPNRVKFTYKSRLFVIPRPTLPTFQPEALKESPWYFNLTLG
jgi:hypothetical protein